MDLLLINGTVHTLNEKEETASAIGMKDGRICFIGTTEEASALEAGQVVDLQGKAVLPGFNDSHIHMVTYAWYENSLKMHNADSVFEIVESAKEFMKGRDYSGGRWFIGRGWNQMRFSPPQTLTREDLDQVSEEVPIVFLRICGHVSVGNTKALELIARLPQAQDQLANIDMETGVMMEGAARLFMAALTPYQKKDIKELICYAADRLNECGITSVHTDDITLLPTATTYEIADAFRSLAREGRLNVRAYCLASCGSKELIKGYSEYGFKSGEGDEFFRFGPVKLIVDGSLGGKTAALTDPYEGSEGNYGIAYYTVDELAEVLDDCRKRELDATIHAIGDRAMEIAVKAIAKSNAKYGRGRRHGILHAQIASEAVLEQMAQEGVTAFMQPVFLSSDMDYAENAVKNAEHKKFYAFASMLKKGITVAGSACSPVESFNVLENIQYAVTREKLTGGPEGGWLPEEKLSVMEAVRLFTSQGAYASYEEGVKGTLEVSKYADMVILSHDIFKVVPSAIKDIRVEATILNGKTVYQRD